MHLLECEHYADDCGCRCHCHRRCGAPLPRAGGVCWRLPGHGGGNGGGHRSRWAVEYIRVRSAQINLSRRMA